MGTHYTKKRRQELKEQFLQYYDESKAMQATSAERIGVTGRTIENWRKSDEEFNEKMSEIEKKWGEWVKGKLMTLIENNNVSAIIFYCKTRLGFSEKKEVEVSTKKSIDVEKALEDIKKTLGEED